MAETIQFTKPMTIHVGSVETGQTDVSEIGFIVPEPVDIALGATFTCTVTSITRKVVEQ